MHTFRSAEKKYSGRDSGIWTDLHFRTKFRRKLASVGKWAGSSGRARVTLSGMDGRCSSITQPGRKPGRVHFPGFTFIAARTFCSHFFRSTFLSPNPAINRRRTIILPMHKVTVTQMENPFLTTFDFFLGKWLDLDFLPFPKAF